MKINNKLEKWAEAHTCYSCDSDMIANSKEKELKKRGLSSSIKNAPHKGLLKNNAFFDAIDSSEKIWLAHVTPNLHNIIKNDTLYPSSGCLVGSIYCTPVFPTDRGLRMHNLGDYVYKKEPAQFLGEEVKKDLQLLLIELEIPKNKLPHIGVNYLHLGNIHLDIYQELTHLLSTKEQEKLEEACTNKAQKTLNYFNVCHSSHQEDLNISPLDFIEIFLDAAQSLPILGYFYFEVLSEYIMLFQKNEKAAKYHELGEFYSPSYKELVKDLCPSLNLNFNLSKFNPEFEKVLNYMEENKIVQDFNKEEFTDYVANRIVRLTNLHLLNTKENKISNWKTINWDFDSLAQYAGPLMGHLIHRELRNMGRYPNFYFYFDQYKALQAWNYWNHMDIPTPFNGVMPKGEVGINPAYPELNYKVHKAKINNKKDFMYVKPDKELNLKIIPRLIDPKFVNMRNSEGFNTNYKMS